MATTQIENESCQVIGCQGEFCHFYLAPVLVHLRRCVLPLDTADAVAYNNQLHFIRLVLVKPKTSCDWLIWALHYFPIGWCVLRSVQSRRVLLRVTRTGYAAVIGPGSPASLLHTTRSISPCSWISWPRCSVDLSVTAGGDGRCLHRAPGGVRVRGCRWTTL